MKFLLWAPFMVCSLIQSILPRSAFVKTYRPSSEEHRKLESSARNGIRGVSYNIKKVL